VTTPIRCRPSRITIGLSVAALVLTPAAVLFAALLFEVTPQNAKADGPQTGPDPFVAEAVRGCVEALGIAKVETQGGVAHVTCRPDLGIVPVARRGRR
jgi:hypothetical protein